MFVDAVGSMALEEALGTERWRVLIERFYVLARRIVETVGGAVHRFTGDGLVALFGASVAVEDHARRACLAALELHARSAVLSNEIADEQLTFALRIGISSGEAIAGNIGDEERARFDTIGPAVGLGSRMEAVARPGTTALTAETARLVEDDFELRDLGELAVKGAKQMRVFELVAQRAAPGRLAAASARGALTPFVGRIREWHALETALECAFDGDGQVVALEGEPGVGKSRLAYEFTRRFSAQGITMHRVSAVSYGRSTPLLPVLELWRSVLGTSETDEPATAREKIAASLLALDRALEADLPLIFEFLGVDDPAMPAPRIDADARERRLLALLGRMIEARSERGPGALVVEDLQWLDEASSVFLAELVRSTAGTRTLLITTFRPGYEAAWIRERHCRHLQLPPLGEDVMASLLAELLGSGPSVDGLAQLIGTRADGNPFFCEELVQALAESGHLAGSRGDYRLERGVEGLVLPATVQAVISARIDAQQAEEKRVLWQAAVIGFAVDQMVLREVAGLDDGPLADVLEALVRAGFLSERIPGRDREYVFKHPLTHEVAYNSQLTGGRQQTHAAVVAAVVRIHPERLNELAGLLAYHSERADELAPAAQWHAQAAVWASRTSPSEATRHWQEAARLADQLPEGPERDALATGARLGALSGAWRTNLPAGEPERIHREAVELASTGHLGPARILADLAYHGVLAFGGRERDALEFARACSRQATEDLNLIVARCAAHGFSAANVGELREAGEVANLGLETAGDDVTIGAMQGLELPYAHCLMYRGYAQAWLGDIDAGLVDLARAVELTAARGAREDHAYALFWRTNAFGTLGDGSAALADAEEALRFAEEAGSTVALSVARAGLAQACALTGDLDRAESMAREGLELIGVRRVPLQIVPVLQNWLAESMLRRGAAAEAAELARVAADTMRDRSLLLTEPPARLTLARALAAADGAAGRAAALVELDRAMEIAHLTECRIWEPAIRTELAVLDRRRGSYASCQLLTSKKPE